MIKPFSKEYGSITSGFTLVEILISIFLLSVSIIILANFGSDIFSFNNRLQTGLKNQSEAKNLIRPFANEIRGSSESNSGSYAIAFARSSELIFYSDIDGDGSRERVRYFLDGTDFKKGYIKPVGAGSQYVPTNEKIVSVVHDVVSTQIFFYYDSDYSGDATYPQLSEPFSPSDVRLIKIELVIDSLPNDDISPFSVTTQVSLRNLKDNL